MSRARFKSPPRAQRLPTSEPKDAHGRQVAGLPASARVARRIPSLYGVMLALARSPMDLARQVFADPVAADYQPPLNPSGSALPLLTTP